MGLRGPAPLPAHEKRVHRVGLYLNEAELERMERVVGVPGLAELVRSASQQRKGMRAISDLLRAKLLRQQLPVRVTVPELNQRMAADIGRVGGNINQIAHHLNQTALVEGRARPDVTAIIEDLNAMRDVLEDALLGIGGSLAAPGRHDNRIGDVDLIVDF